MKKHNIIGDFGETAIIKIIESVIHEITGKILIQDDSFFFALPPNKDNKMVAVFNSDMLVSTTDIPPQMDFHQIGRKSVIMNISDLIVKNVKPRAMIISMGLPKDLYIKNFKDIIRGIVECSRKYDLDYIGGDINETKEIIINPTIFGYQEDSKIIHREGINEGDVIVANGKFGLTGVGFDILLNKKGDISQYPSYKRSIMSVLEPVDFKGEAFILGDKNLASASIDSSDGLAKSLKELISSNSKIGFEINFNEELMDEEAVRYSKEFNISLKDLIFNAGEEFIHLFTIPNEDILNASKIIRDNHMELFRIGRVISDEKIYIIEKSQKKGLTFSGFEHFKNN
ncbi:MAG: thiamine-monophosphate kinase [Promethearchaeota archaeon]